MLDDVLKVLDALEKATSIAVDVLGLLISYLTYKKLKK